MTSSEPWNILNGNGKAVAGGVRGTGLPDMSMTLAQFYADQTGQPHYICRGDDVHGLAWEEISPRVEAVSIRTLGGVAGAPRAAHLIAAQAPPQRHGKQASVLGQVVDVVLRPTASAAEAGARKLAAARGWRVVEILS